MYPCMVLYHQCPDSEHPADFEDARLHRRIQSAEHIARLAESKASAHTTSKSVLMSRRLMQICRLGSLLLFYAFIKAKLCAGRLVITHLECPS